MMSPSSKVPEQLARLEEITKNHDDEIAGIKEGLSELTASIKKDFERVYDKIDKFMGIGWIVVIEIGVAFIAGAIAYLVK